MITRRRRLQNALARVFEVYHQNLKADIAPDLITARLAALISRLLFNFAREAGLTDKEVRTAPLDLSRIDKLLQDRKRATASRLARRQRQIAKLKKHRRK
jgi:hypothetical protein